MLTRRDTRIEASRVRCVSPLQTVEDQSQAWGIRFHSCTGREGLAPSWCTELQSRWLCGLPEDISPLSTNGSHEIIVHVIQGQLLAHALLVLAQRGDASANSGHMLAQAEVEAFNEGAVLIDR